MHPNYLSDHRDAEIIIKGIWGAGPLTKPHLFSSTVLIRTKPHLFSSTMLIRTKRRCYHAAVTSSIQMHTGNVRTIRYMTFIMFQQSGTRKMGPDSDPDVVADSSLRVLEIKHLRVSDASIIPLCRRCT
jgi:choline dehydrogenase-like flavoprotein